MPSTQYLERSAHPSRCTVNEHGNTEKKQQICLSRSWPAYIDQSVLKPEFTQDDIRKYIQEGIDYGCRTVCVNPASLRHRRRAVRRHRHQDLRGVRFPLRPVHHASPRCLQAEEYCKTGRHFLSWTSLPTTAGSAAACGPRSEADIKRRVPTACHKYGTAVKVILRDRRFDPGAR